MADELKPAQVANLFVNEQGFVYASNSKLCKIRADGTLVFLHRGGGQHRQERGREVTVKLADLGRLVELRQAAVDKSGPDD